MIHHVFANRSNIGDWLAAKGIQRLLQPLPVTEHLCDADYWVLDHADLAPLGQRREALPGQCDARGFVEHARTQNQQVATLVAALAGVTGGRS